MPAVLVDEPPKPASGRIAATVLDLPRSGPLSIFASAPPALGMPSPLVARLPTGAAHLCAAGRARTTRTGNSSQQAVMMKRTLAGRRGLRLYEASVGGGMGGVG